MSLQDDMQTVIDNTVTQLLAIQTQKSAILTQIADLDISADMGPSVTVSGEGGSFSVDRVGYLRALQDQLNMLADVELRLTEALAKQQESLITFFPYREVLVQYV